MTALDALARYLDSRSQSGRPLALWWRDDDLEMPSDALSACLDALTGHGITPAFAAIPEGVTEPAVKALQGTDAAVFPHGWSHANHALAGEKKSEFGPGRPARERLDDIARGWRRIDAVAGERAIACFVPPWNRIGDDILGQLDGAGITALSTFASPRRAPAAAAVPRLETHIDLIDWRGSGRALPAARLAACFREQDGVDAPLGILSHHRVTDREAWEDWRPVLALLSDHPAARWLSPREALARVGVEPTERRTG